ncbi:hypothetical protein TNCV_1612141 [Trichonephila clavipes]|nr:hypothetical protein TNCV_1612141 [Trichonephila clavipes]
MFTITVQHMSYEVHLQCTLLYHPLAAGEDNLPDPKLALVENGRGVSHFRLTLYNRFDNSLLCDEQQLLYLTQVYQPQLPRCYLSGLDCVQFFVNLHHVRLCGMNVFHEVDDVTGEKFCDLAFVDQETARDTF